MDVIKALAISKTFFSTFQFTAIQHAVVHLISVSVFYTISHYGERNDRFEYASPFCFKCLPLEFMLTVHSFDGSSLLVSTDSNDRLNANQLRVRFV